MNPAASPANLLSAPPCRVVAWEVTRRCNLKCLHCRASAKNIPYFDELDTSEALSLVSSFTQMGTPLIIFTGGEPLLRQDIFELLASTAKMGCAQRFP